MDITLADITLADITLADIITLAVINFTLAVINSSQGAGTCNSDEDGQQ